MFDILVESSHCDGCHDRAVTNHTVIARIEESSEIAHDILANPWIKPDKKGQIVLVEDEAAAYFPEEMRGIESTFDGK